MAVFSGTVVNKIDAKGRVSVPVKFRQLLIEQGNQSVLMIRSSNEPAIEAFGQELLSKLTKNIEGLDPMSAAFDDQARLWFAEQSDVSWDAEGRIRIPDELRDFAKLGGEIAFVGMLHKFQIWDAETFRALHPPRAVAGGRA